ncbi:MAG: hypothetical protein AAFZ49_15390 [Cyanobacteria bacterium J06659_2]
MGGSPHLVRDLKVQQLIQLIQGQDDRIVDALLVDLSQFHLDAFDSLWRPLLQQFEEEDKFWD